jgi:hypothetical protein
MDIKLIAKLLVVKTQAKIPGTYFESVAPSATSRQTIMMIP